MIQEPRSQVPQQQQQQQQQRQQIQQTYESEENRITVTEIVNAIPILIDPTQSQRILLITTTPNTQGAHQSNSEWTNRTATPIATTATTRVISVPFLPRSEALTLLVKKNTRPKNISIKNSNSNDRTQVQTATTTTAVQVQSLTEQRTQTIIGSERNTEAATSDHMTLASMAGICLTDADESSPDMSGAMPPTATVEEINVPVFIDEYLQQSTPTSIPHTATTTAAAVAATTLATDIVNNNSNYNNDHKNNPNITNGIENNGYGNEICFENKNAEEAFEDFEFDIDLIEDTIEDQMYNNNSNGSVESCYHYLFDKDFTTTTTNNSNTMYNNNIMNNNSNNNRATLADNSYSMYNYDEGTGMREDFDPQYHVAPSYNLDTDISLSQDTLSQSLIQFDVDMQANEAAIDITKIPHSTLSDILLNSQNPLLCDAMPTLYNEEPHCPDYSDKDIKIDSYAKFHPVPAGQISSPDLFTGLPAAELGNSDVAIINTTNHILQSNISTKRRASARLRSTDSKNMAEKRLKLRLDTTQRAVCVAGCPDTITTPDIVKIVSDMQSESNECQINPEQPVDIINFLRSYVDASSTQPEPEAQIIAEEKSVEFSAFCRTDFDGAPLTPQSITSSINTASHTNTTQTGFTTSPNSPACSIASSCTATTSVKTRQRTRNHSSCSSSHGGSQAGGTSKRRGRPSKEHSDRPDPQQMESLTESERKRVEDRAKNNEASRLSRRKNKERETFEVQQERSLIDRNERLTEELKRHERDNKKLMRAMQRLHFEGRDPN